MTTVTVNVFPKTVCTIVGTDTANRKRVYRWHPSSRKDDDMYVGSAYALDGGPSVHVFVDSTFFIDLVVLDHLALSLNS